MFDWVLKHLCIDQSNFVPNEGTPHLIQVMQNSESLYVLRSIHPMKL